MGHTQPQGDPGGVYVNGSVHIKELQSWLGGGGGSVITGKGGGLRFFPFKDELVGDIVGVAVGIPK